MARALAGFMLLAFLLAGCRTGPGYRVLHEGGWPEGPPPPRGEVILTVVTPEKTVRLDQAALEALTWVELVTKSHPKEKLPPGRFEGVRLKDLFGALKVQPIKLRFVALDGYSVQVDWKKIAPFDPMLALKEDGRPLEPIFAPIRVVFPYDRLKPDPLAYNRYWVWKLSVIYIER